MKFIETKLKGAYLIKPDLISDDRGFFARSWCQDEFADKGLNPNLVQCNISFNHRQGTLRGMHYQTAPHEEAKLVRCTAGAIYDVVIDLRSDSKSFKQWVAVELTAANHQALYIPRGMAHGFQTLVDNSEVLYQMSEFYHPESARGIRWDDQVLGIAWPTESPSVISERDLSYADFDL
jgi:dTDP-4-dehydrorhamnose 3,5-epimerase